MEISGSVLQELLNRMTLLCDHLDDSFGEPSTVPYTLTQLLEIAAEHRASVISINIGTPPALRINGQLSFVEGDPLNDADCRKLLAPVCTPELREQLYKSGQAQSCIPCSGSGFKAYLYLERGHLCASLHRLRSDIPKVSALGLGGSQVTSILEQPSGLILLTGLPRSGKINTLASLISHMNTTRLARIITLEKPIQFWHYSQSSTVLQREVGTDVPTFPEAIRQALNQDVNILGISAIPDRETASAAIRAAAGGKLVIAVMDATSSVQALERILEACKTEEGSGMTAIFAKSLRAVLHQTLVNRSDKRGVIPAFEILSCNDEVQAELRSGSAAKLSAIMKKSGMQTLGKSLSRLVAAGLVKKEDALECLQDPAELDLDGEVGNLNDTIIAAGATPSQAALYDEAAEGTLDTEDTPLMSWL